MKRRNRTAGPDLFSLRCETCNAYMVRTPSDYLVCPAGHGRLQLATELDTPATSDEPCGSWFHQGSPEE